MANTYTQIHLQLIFGVKYREALIHPNWETELHKYISEIIMNRRHKLLCINGVEDHLHVLIGYRPSDPLPDLMEEIKADSSKWINKRGFIKYKFHWQGGYGAFSYSKSDLMNVINYIKNQKEHHRKISFVEEYNKFLQRFEVDFDERYIFKQPISIFDDIYLGGEYSELLFSKKLCL